MKPDKIKAVKEFPRPRNSKNIKQFLDLAGYYRHFISNFAKIAKPLTNLLRKNEKFIWSETQDEAFANLRDSLCAELLLQYPDFTKPFLIATDTSGYAIDGILSQGHIGKNLSVTYTSRLLAKADRNYSMTEE